MIRKLGLLIVWLIDLAVVLLGGWRPRIERVNRFGMKFKRSHILMWEKTVQYKDCEYTYLLRLPEASQRQENLWRIGK